MRFCMDEAKSNFDWNRAKALLFTAETGSFSGAARVLGTTQSTIGRQITALEEELGVVLVERIGKGVELTEGGWELLEHIKVMGKAAEGVSRVAAGQSVALEGEVSISASEVISAFLLPPIINAILDAYPGLRIEVIATNQTSDLRRRQADIAIRNYQPKDPELVVRKVRDTRAFLYATKAYLERVGSPDGVEDFGKARFLGFDFDGRLMELLNHHGMGLRATNFGVVSANQLVQWEMVKQDLGIGVMMESVGEREEKVVPVLRDIVSFPFPIWLTAHREVKASQRIRVVFDALHDGLLIENR
ncbi:LysR family transcriptional regulator [Microvenator marinus]|uniref:LysR family transcriptional regulator n=2 Tax=Microvenator marinus TaxID=2600177 RepID=A0A5B8XNC9_9DELT|nr:LysR family transcriptional regulator [Microvenator marinus]